MPKSNNQKILGLQKKHRAEPMELVTLGWREWVSLPDLGISHIKAKVDTGARTSSLHAYFIEDYYQDEEHRVKFGIHPHQDDLETTKICDAAVLDERDVSDSGGHIERRFVIETRAVVGDIERKIEITLTNRDTMKFRMLLGRTAMNGQFCVDPQSSFLFGRPKM